MKTRILRWLLPVILVAAGSGSGAWTWALAEHVDQLEATGRQAAARIDRLELLLDGLTRGELTYLTAGLTAADSLAAASESLQQIATESAWLLGQLLTGAAPAAGAVAKDVASLAEVDARARDNMQAGLDLMAADLLFTETTRTRQTLREQLRTLRTLESRAIAQARADSLKQAWTVLAGVALLFAWALIRSTRGSGSAPARDVELVPSSAVDPAPVAGFRSQDAPPSIDLAETAQLCTAISRLRADADLEGLLARTAALLGASGVVVWMTAGEEMFPVAWHGYESKQLSRLGPIRRAAPNATAAAWRSGTLQRVSGDSTSRSAIVVPMFGVERCVGVLAIEVAAGREADATAHAVTTLIAAQLATVPGAWPAGSSVVPVDVMPFEQVSASGQG